MTPVTTLLSHSTRSLAWSRVDSFDGNYTEAALTAARPCPICGSVSGRTVLTFAGVQFYSDSREVPKRVDVVERQCDGCFAVFLDPCYTPYAFETLFTEVEQSYGAVTGRAAEQIAWLGDRGLLRPGGEILDVGCYEGRFLAQIPDGLRRVGLDIDLPSIERGRRLYGHLGVEFVHGDFETFSYDGSPDAITLLAVLEHLPRPTDALAKLRSISHEGTRLVVEVPLLENEIGPDVFGFFSPHHMTHFSRASLRNCLAGAGWEPVEWHEAPDYNGCRVLAAPSAVSAPVGDAGDVVAVRRHLAHWNTAVASVEARLEPIPDDANVVVWGAGTHAEWLYQLTSLFRPHGGRRYLLVDRDAVKQGTSWRGIPVQSPEEVAAAAAAEGAWLVASSYRNTCAIAADAESLGFARERIVTLYDDEAIRLY
jgi:Methyltransferase domain